MVSRLKRLAIGAAATVLVAGCGGGGTGVTVPPPTPQPTGTPGPASAVSLAIAIPAPLTASARARSPRYVSPATLQIQVVVNGGTPQSFQVGSGAPCVTSQVPANGTCSVYQVQAPAGLDTFTVTLLDGSGNVLSQGSAQAAIVAQQANTVTLVFNGVVSSISVLVSNATPRTGTAGAFVVSLFPLDHAGFTILGAPGALPAITVTDGERSGATALYLAGSDGTCATMTGTPSSSVTATQSGAYYTRVCLRYTGAALAAPATITATISGGPSGSATFAPAAPPSTVPSGAWLIGATASGQPTALERIDASANVVSVITGSSTGFAGTLAGLATDSSGNVFVAQYGVSGLQVLEFPPNAFGNVAPSSVATVTGGGVVLGPEYARDPAGNGSFLASNGVTFCQLFSVPPASGTVTAIADCQPETNKLRNPHLPTQLAAESPGLIDVGFDDFSGDGNGPQSPNGPSSIYRFKVNGTVASPLSAISFAGSLDGPIAIDPNGNVVVTLLNRQTGVPSIAVLPAAGFNDGNVSPVTPIDTYDPSVGTALTEDLAGNLYAQSSSSSVGVVPAGSHAVAQTTSFVAAYGAPVRNTAAPNSSGSLTATPAIVQTPGQSRISVSEPGYSGQFLESDTCGGKTTVTPQSANGPNAVFAVGAATAPGTCVATFRDAGANTVQVQIGVTTTTITGSARRRSLR